MGIDKIKHLIAGLIISLLGGLVNPLLGLWLAVLAGALKEYYDSLGYGCVEFWDFGCTWLGGLIGYMVWLGILALL